MAAPSTRNIVPLLPTAAATLEIDLTPIEVYVSPQTVDVSYNQSISLTPIAVQVAMVDPALSTLRNINLSPLVIEVGLVTPLVGIPIAISLSPVVVEVALITPLLGVDQNIDLSPIVVHVATFSPTIATPTAINLSPIVVYATMVDPDLDTNIPLSPIVIEVYLPQLAMIRPRGASVEGVVGGLVYNAAGAVPTGLSGHLQNLVAWEAHRYINRVGEWNASWPAADLRTNGVPMATSIKRGWRVSLVQDNTHPNDDLALQYLVYKGIVENKEYEVGDDGQALLRVEGGFNTMRLVSRLTPVIQTFNNSPLETTANEIINPTGESDEIGTVVVPDPHDIPRTITVEYNGGDDNNDPLSRYARLRQFCEYCHWGIREPWEADTIELFDMRIPASTVPSYTVLSVEQTGPEWALAGQSGIAIIAGTPTMRVEGVDIVNRVIPYGIDTTTVDAETVNIPLTLEACTIGQPYPVRYRKDGAVDVWFMEDRDSINQFGLYELVLHREDVRNPTDDAGNRNLAANALHTVAAYELMKRRAPIIKLDIELANGPHVWALPGDVLQLDYTGNVNVGDGVVTWLEFSTKVLVVERHDTGGPDTRNVRLVVSIPDIAALNLPNPNYSPDPGDVDPEEDLMVFDPTLDIGKAIVPGLSPYGAGCCGSRQSNLGDVDGEFEDAAPQLWLMRGSATPVPPNSSVLAPVDAGALPVGGVITAVYVDGLAGGDVYIDGVLAVAGVDGSYVVAAGDVVTFADSGGGDSIVALFTPEFPGWFSYMGGSLNTPVADTLYRYPAFVYSETGGAYSSTGLPTDISGEADKMQYASVAPYDGALRRWTVRRPNDDSALSRTFVLYLDGVAIEEVTMEGPTAYQEIDLDLNVPAGSYLTVGVWADVGDATQLCQFALVFEPYVDGWAVWAGNAIDGTTPADFSAAWVDNPGGVGGINTVAPVGIEMRALSWFTDGGSGGNIQNAGTSSGDMSIGPNAVDSGSGLYAVVGDNTYVTVSGNDSDGSSWAVAVRVREEEGGGGGPPPGA